MTSNRSLIFSYRSRPAPPQPAEAPIVVSSGQCSVVSGQPRKILLVANTAWNFVNFRLPLIRALQGQGCEVVCAAPADGFETQLEGLRFVPLKHLSRKGLSPWEHLLLYHELCGLLRRENPDQAVFYTIKPNIFGNFAARRCGVPAVSVVEGLGYVASPPLLRKLAFLLYRPALKLAKHVVFLNQADRMIFEHAGAVRRGHFTVIPGSGVDTKHFSLQEKTADEGPVFLFVGRLLTDKGIREFAEAAERVRKKHPNAEFRILGAPDPGNPASILPSELRHWTEGGHVRWLGTATDVRPHLAQADAVVLPSYREGMSRALLEGMAMGKPIITTFSSGCKELVEEGLNGFLAPSGDSGALVEVLERFLDMPLSRRLAMGRYSRLKAEKEFSDDVVLPEYMGLILAS
ncbi:MAG: glycosyltransferase family 4 protein [Saprospiraceae bacterium]|nr:glycosyltransferase family 4 protein [Saprospiraceae bacterium]